MLLLLPVPELFVPVRSESRDEGRPHPRVIVLQERSEASTVKPKAEKAVSNPSVNG